MTAKKAVFLDRDGVINALIYHQDAGVIDSPFTLRQFRVLPRVPRAIRVLNDLGFVVVVVSNQPGVAKGHFSKALLERQERKLVGELKRAGARIDRIYYCLHHPEAIVKRLRRRCRCRKPGTGMLVRAAAELGLSLRDSYMMGDGVTDLMAGARAGCRTVFIGRWKCEICQLLGARVAHPDLAAKDLWEASQLIKAETQKGKRLSVRAFGA